MTEKVVLFDIADKWETKLSLTLMANYRRLFSAVVEKRGGLNPTGSNHDPSPLTHSDHGLEPHGVESNGQS